MKSKKKVILAVTKSNFGGAQRYVFDIASSLPKDEYDIKVLCGGNGLLLKKLSDVGIEVISLPYVERDITLFKELKALIDLTRIFIKEKPDIIHLNSPKIGGLGALAGRITRINKIIYTAHGWTYFEKRPLLQRIIIRIFSYLIVLLSTKTITITHKDTHSAMNFPLLRRKIFYIPNASKVPDFLEKDIAKNELLKKDWAINNETKLLITIAELHPNKNITLAIDAVSKARKEGANIFYSIIGEGELKSELQKRIDTLGASEFIKLLGYIEDAPKYLKGFDFFLLTSKKEGLPYVILEAGLAGLNVIATNVGGIPDIINSNNGFLLNSNSSDELAKILINNMNANRGVELKASIEQKHSFANFIIKIQNLYK